MLREVEVDNNVHSLDVDTSGEQVSADKASGLSVFEVVVNSKQIKVKISIFEVKFGCAYLFLSC